MKKSEKMIIKFLDKHFDEKELLLMRSYRMRCEDFCSGQTHAESTVCRLCYNAKMSLSFVALKITRLQKCWSIFNSAKIHLLCHTVGRVASGIGQSSANCNCPFVSVGESKIRLIVQHLGNLDDKLTYFKNGSFLLLVLLLWCWFLEPRETGFEPFTYFCFSASDN